MKETLIDCDKTLMTVTEVENLVQREIANIRYKKTEIYLDYMHSPKKYRIYCPIFPHHVLLRVKKNNAWANFYQNGYLSCNNQIQDDIPRDLSKDFLGQSDETKLAFGEWIRNILDKKNNCECMI